MDQYGSEDEQVEALKRWWRENGRSVIAGALIAVVGLVGWQQWRSHQQQQSEAASTEYLAFLEQIRGDQAEGGVARGRQVIEEFPGSPYAVLTALWLADHQADQGRPEQAQEQLSWVVENADNDAFRQLAKFRLAEARLAQQDYDGALDALQPVLEGPYASLYHERIGDIQAARGATGEAVEAYQAALAAEDLAGQRRQLVELKLTDLGVEEPLS